MPRPRRPNMDSIREKKFSLMIEDVKHRPHNDTVNSVDSRNFSLDGNDLYRYKPEELAGQEYKRCLELFERRLPEVFALPTPQAVVRMQKMNKMIFNSMLNKEMSHIEELKRIAVDTVRSLFDIPEHVEILPDISMEQGVDQDEQDDSPEPVLSLSPEEWKRMKDEIQKRVILNGLVHGSAMHIWKSAHYIIKDQIESLNPMLMGFYNQYTASIGWALWQMPPDYAQGEINQGGMTQGFNKLEFDEEGEAECKIRCVGVNFPVLLHEVTKGAMDYLICHGIPKDFSEDELKYYYAKADSYENEFWHYLLSPTVWTSLVDAAGVDTQELPLVIAKLTQLSYEELTGVLKACIDGPEEGALKLKKENII